MALSGKICRVPQDIFEELNKRAFQDDEDRWNHLRGILGLKKKRREKAKRKKTSGKSGRAFKYDVTDLQVGESKTIYNVHPELALPCIHRYGRTRGKAFQCQGGPGCITVTRVK